jgi:L-lactate dehydrogenase complex protein LldE
MAADTSVALPEGWRSANLSRQAKRGNQLTQPTPNRASLFVTCIIDQLFPDVGASVVRVLRQHGIGVDFPPGQTCCGQPLYNAGFAEEAKKLAVRVLDAFADCEFVVVPSGSCGAMMRVFYLDLFADDPDLLRRAEAMSRKVYEFTEFLVDVQGIQGISAPHSAETCHVAYHPSCHLLREMQVRNAPTDLLESLEHTSMVELPNAEQCCGFGGAFAVKYPHISEAMLDDKVAAIVESGADTITACDMGCLMHIGGAISRRQLPVRVRHIAQMLDSGVQPNDG